jgi:hypothetical protein
MKKAVLQGTVASLISAALICYPARSAEPHSTAHNAPQKTTKSQLQTSSAAPSDPSRTAELKQAQSSCKSGDYARAFPVFLRLAQTGSAPAQHELARLLIGGHGTKKNEPQAFVWCKKSATQGYVPAEFELGRMYEDGIGTHDDISEAVRWLQLASAHGSALAAYELSGICSAEAGGPAGGEKEFERYLQLACERGNSDAMERLGDLYRNGQFGPSPKKDFKSALKWYQKAAEIGNKESIFKAAILLDSGGFGLAHDRKAAAAEYDRSLKLGLNYFGAASRLADMYHTGDGVQKNEKLSLRYRQLAEKFSKNDDSINRGMLTDTR